MQRLQGSSSSRSIAALERMVRSQQMALSELVHDGQRSKAREARGRLYALLNELDLLQECQVSERSA